MLVPAARFAALVAAAASVSGAAVPREHIDPLPTTGPDAYPSTGTGIWLPPTTMAYSIEGTDVTCSEAQLQAFSNFINGGGDAAQFCLANDCSPNCSPNDHYAHTKNTLHFHDIDFTATRNPFGDPPELIYNNLGGQGPNNGCGCDTNNGCESWTEALPNGATNVRGNPDALFCASNPGACLANNNGRYGLRNSCINPQPARIELAAVTRIKCDGAGLPNRLTPLPPHAIEGGITLGATQIPDAACLGADRPNALVPQSALNLRIYSTGVYRPADYGVDENGYLFDSTVGGSGATSSSTGMVQINLRPAYNELARAAVDPAAENDYEQPFISGLLRVALQTQAIFGTLLQLLPDVGANIFDGRYSNTVNLALVFATQDGAPYVLDEFYLSFFDFDQDYADGSYAFVRETLLMYEYTTAFMDSNTEIERRETNQVLAGGVGFGATLLNIALQNSDICTQAPASTKDLVCQTGGITVRTLPGAPTATCPQGGYYLSPRRGSPDGTGVIDYETCSDVSVLAGGVFRSSREGTGVYQKVKYVRERCEGFCSRGTNNYVQAPIAGGHCTGNNRNNPNGGALNIFAAFCTQGTGACTVPPGVTGGGAAGGTVSAAFAWTGCGFADSVGPSVSASGYGPDNIPGGQAEIYQAGSSIACEMDCPRLRILTGTSTATLAPYEPSAIVGYNQDNNNNNCGGTASPTEFCDARAEAGGYCNEHCDDAGNPTDINNLSNQQKRRAVTFLFRRKWRVALQFRTEIGGDAITNSNNALYFSGPNQEETYPWSLYTSTYSGQLNNLSPDAGAQTFLPPVWSPGINFQVPFCPQATTNPPVANGQPCLSLFSPSENRNVFNPNKGRLTLGTPQDPKGRNFLFASQSALVSCPEICLCDTNEKNTCSSSRNGVCDASSTCAAGTDAQDCGDCFPGTAFFQFGSNPPGCLACSNKPPPCPANNPAVSHSRCLTRPSTTASGTTSTTPTTRISRRRTTSLSIRRRRSRCGKRRRRRSSSGMRRRRD